MKKVLCFYHFECPDGIFAAWLINMLPDRDVFWTPYEWHKPITSAFDLFDEIYFVDIAPDIPVLEKILSNLREGQKLWILDHHDSTLKEFAASLALPGQGYVSQTVPYSLMSGDGIEKFWHSGKTLKGGEFHFHLDKDHSGAGLTYAHVLKNYEHDSKVKRIIDMVEDRDTWKFKLPNSRDFYYSNQQNLDLAIANPLILFEVIDKLYLEGDLELEIEKGKSVRIFCDAKIAQYAKTYQIIEIDGMRIPLINVHKDWGSDTCSHMVNSMEEFPRAAYFLFNQGDIYMGFRSRSKEFPVNDIAKKFGGGGHEAAAACHLTLETFTNVLQGKYK